MRSPALSTLFEHGAEYSSPGAKLGPCEWVVEFAYVTDGDDVGRFTFDGREYQIEILEAFFGAFEIGEIHRTGVVFKGSQAGITLICQLGLLYLLIEHDESVFHLLPRSEDAVEKARKIGEMIESSEYLSKQFVKSKSTKRRTIRARTFTVPGSNSQPELKNWQAKAGVCDETDELTRIPFDSLASVKKRMGSYEQGRRLFYIGTPTLPDFGIDLTWKSSDQRYYHVPCGYCDEYQILDFDKNIDWNKDLDDNAKNIAETAFFKCAHCDKKWDRQMRKDANRHGYWEASQPQNKIIGFNLSRLYVCSSAASVIVEDFLDGQISDYKMKEHVNQNLAKTYLPEGGKLDESTIRQRIDLNLTWGRVPKGTEYITAGIDVQGAQEPFEFVFEVQAYNQGHATVVEYGRTKSAKDVEGLLGTHDKRGAYDVSLGLIDITDGKHKGIVEHLCSRIPCLRPASHAHTKDPFERSKVKKVKSGPQKGRAYLINKDDALTEHTNCFKDLERRPACISIAPNPKRGKETIYVQEFTKVVRIDKVYPDGGVRSFWIKTTTTGVDAPYAGMLATYAGRRTKIHRSHMPATTDSFGPAKAKSGRKNKTPRAEMDLDVSDFGVDKTGYY